MSPKAECDKYGYADPDTAAKYGYEDSGPASVDYGYGDGTPDAANHDYGEAPDTAAAPVTDYGYGDAAPDSAENGDGAPGPLLLRPLIKVTEKAPAPVKDHGCGGEEDVPRPRQRYARRGSVTRYSIVAHNTVVEEFKEHENIIDRFRSGGGDASGKATSSSLPLFNSGPNASNNSTPTMSNKTADLQPRHRVGRVELSRAPSNSSDNKHSDDGHQQQHPQSHKKKDKRQRRNSLVNGMRSMRRFSLRRLSLKM